MTDTIAPLGVTFGSLGVLGPRGIVDIATLFKKLTTFDERVD